MATNEHFNTKMEYDDIDDDIERLNIILQDDEKLQDEESDGELQVLEQTEDDYYSHASCPSASSSVTASSFPTTSVCTEADDLVYRFDPSTINPESCLAMNRAYQEVLLDMLRQIEMTLVENRSKQKQLEEDIKEDGSKSGRETNANKRVTGEYSLPYFKDKKGNCPPFNEDVKLKNPLLEVKQHVRPKSGWTKEQRKALLSAIRLDALEQQIRPLLNKLEIETTKIKACKTTEQIKEVKERIDNLKQAMEDKQKTTTDKLLREVNSDRIDYMKISIAEFNGKYDSSECESMWRNVLHPEINRERWAKEEEERLEALTIKYKMRNWEQIAVELGTGRTPFQCLQHYQQNNMVYETSPWTLDEDDLLMEVVETCRYGNGKIPWHQVAYYVDGRSANMCETRWRKINPAIKRGKWTKQEDCLLMTAVNMTGHHNWALIQEFVPGRTAQQCRERWCNCLDPHLKMDPFTYEEDKLILKYHKQYGNNWTAVAGHLPGRSDNMVIVRYNRLEKWRRQSEHFYSQPLNVQEDMISPIFEFGPDRQIVPKVYKIDEKSRGRPRRTNTIKVEPGTRSSDSKIEEEGNRVSSLVSNNDKTELSMFVNENDIQVGDYQKQYQDKLNDDIVVPRPPPLRRYTARTYAKTMESREKLQDVVQMQIASSMYQLKTNEISTIVDHVADTLAPALRNKKQLDMISCAMKGKMPHQLSVRELLNISRGIKKTGKPPKDPTEEWDEFEHTSEEEEEEEEEISEEEEEEEEEEVRLPKPKRTLTEKEKATMEARNAKWAKHKVINDQIKGIIQAQMSTAELKTADTNRGRKRTYQMYPPYMFKPCKDQSELEKMKKKSLVLLLKTLDVDVKQVYRRAQLSKRKISAMAMLKSAKTRTRRSHQISQLDTELSEMSETMLDLRKALGIKNEDTNAFETSQTNDSNENEIDGVTAHSSNQTSTAATSTVPCSGVKAGPSRAEEAYDKVLPFIPPNKSNLQAMKTLLLEHRYMIDKAGIYFNPNNLKEQLYNIKLRGPNPLMHVLSSMNRRTAHTRTTKQEEDLKLQLKTTNPQEILKDVKKTKAYLQLKARFQSVFTWPALMSTIVPPRKDQQLPISILDKLDKARVVDDDTADHSKVKQEVDVDDAETEECDRKPDLEDIKNLTEEEAIERLVQKIMDEYKKKREGQKRYMPAKRHRKKQNQTYTRGVYNRERIKILKRLGLYEKMQQFELERNQRMQADNERGSEKQTDVQILVVEHEQSTPEQLTEDSQQVGEQTQTTQGQVTKKQGRPFGSKSACFKPPDENTRRSARTGKKTASKTTDILDDDVDGTSPPSPKKRRLVAVKNQRLKEMLPEKMGELVSKIPDLPIMKEPIPEPAPRTRRRKKSEKQSTGIKEKSHSANDVGEANLINGVSETDSVAIGTKSASMDAGRADSVAIPNTYPEMDGTIGAAESMRNSGSEQSENQTNTNLITPVPVHNPLAMLGTAASVALGQSPMMMAIPVTVAGVQQIACIPIYSDKDGKLIMPQTDPVLSNDGDGKLLVPQTGQDTEGKFVIPQTVPVPNDEDNKLIILQTGSEGKMVMPQTDSVPSDTEGKMILPQTDQVPSDTEGKMVMPRTDPVSSDTEVKMVVPQTDSVPSDTEGKMVMPQTDSVPSDTDGKMVVPQTDPVPSDTEGKMVMPLTNPVPSDTEGKMVMPLTDPVASDTEGKMVMPQTDPVASDTEGKMVIPQTDPVPSDTEGKMVMPKNDPVASDTEGKMVIPLTDPVASDTDGKMVIPQTDPVPSDTEGKMVMPQTDPVPSGTEVKMVMPQTDPVPSDTEVKMVVPQTDPVASNEAVTAPVNDEDCK